MSLSFKGSRLRLARHLRGWTLKELAGKVAVSTSLLSHFENGRREPQLEILEALGATLGFEPGFFMRPSPEPFLEEECSFRRKSVTPQFAKRKVLAHGTLLSELISYLRAELDLPDLDVPEQPGTSMEEAEEAARHCRAYWQLGLGAPLAHVGRVLERAGVVLLAIDTGDERIDAFSRWGEESVVVLNRTKGSASRLRFDLAHELGHLVMHRQTEPGTPDTEDQAHRFASAFLMPREGFARDFNSLPRLDWPNLFELKRHWMVSVGAIVRRAYDLELINAAQYRRFNQYIRAKGWHKGEPQEPEEESPELLGAALQAMRFDLGRSLTDVAEDLGWTLGTMEDLTGIEIQLAPTIDLLSYREEPGERAS